MKKLSVIIVNYNSTPYLRRCLQSLRRETRIENLQIVVVDNASQDADWAVLGQENPDVKFVLNASNVGFSTACNQGIRLCPAEFYLLLNPDTLILDSAIDKTLEFLAGRPDIGIVGCRVKNPDGSPQLAARRTIPRPSTALYRLLGLSRLFPRSRRFAGYNLTYLDPDESHPVEAVSGSFLMFRQETLRDLGGLDEDFFLYGEDLDFCWRALQSGWEVYYFAGAEVLHFKRRSSTKATRAATGHFYSSMKIFYLKHQAPQSTRLKNALVLAGIDLLHGWKRLLLALWGRQGVGSGR